MITLPLFTTYFLYVNDLSVLQRKMLIIFVLVPFVAIYVRRKYGNQKIFSFYDYFVTIMMSILFVWLGYELAIWYQMPTVFVLMISFFIGVYSFRLVVELGKHIFTNLEELIKVLFDKLRKLIE